MATNAWYFLAYLGVAGAILANWRPAGALAVSPDLLCSLDPARKRRGDHLFRRRGRATSPGDRLEDPFAGLMRDLDSSERFHAFPRSIFGAAIGPARSCSGRNFGDADLHVGMVVLLALAAGTYADPGVVLAGFALSS